MLRGGALLAICLALGCSREVKTFVEEPFPERLSEWRLFQGDLIRLQPNERVHPYALNTPLFSDYAEKYRTLWVPPGQHATYAAEGAFDFPVGTVLSKTFMYPVDSKAHLPANTGHAGNEDERFRPLETRLLVHAKDGWVALPYVWDEAGEDATLEIVGASIPASFTTAAGVSHQLDYSVPNSNQCFGCHDTGKKLMPIGLQARHLNRDYPFKEGWENQLDRWTRLGVVKGAPEAAEAPRNAVWDDPKTGTLEARTLAYLDANCAHCHSAKGPGSTSGLFLTSGEPERHRLGICKPPVAAGRASANLTFDVVPGKPAESILHFRMSSTDPGIMMPEVGRSLVHTEGVALVGEWIASLDGECQKVAVSATP